MEVQTINQLVAEAEAKLPHLKPGDISEIRTLLTKARTQLILNKVTATYNNTPQL